MTDQKPRGDMQARILAYIEQEIKTRGYAPSVREIGEAVGLEIHLDGARPSDAD